MTRCLAISLVWLAAAAYSSAQSHHRDALTELEVSKIRDAAQMPDIRLKLYVEFARARLEKLQQVRSDTKATDRDVQTSAALQDFTDVYDELDDNVDTYADRGSDLRKPLKPVIEADTEFGAKLRAFKTSLKAPEEIGKFDFLVSSALEAVDSGAKDHRDLLAEQEQKFKNKKSKDRKDEAQKE